MCLDMNVWISLSSEITKASILIFILVLTRDVNSEFPHAFRGNNLRAMHFFFENRFIPSDLLQALNKRPNIILIVLSFRISLSNIDASFVTQGIFGRMHYYWQCIWKMMLLSRGHFYSLDPIIQMPGLYLFQLYCNQIMLMSDSNLKGN